MTTFSAGRFPTSIRHPFRPLQTSINFPNLSLHLRLQIFNENTAKCNKIVIVETLELQQIDVYRQQASTLYFVSQMRMNSTKVKFDKNT